MTPVGVVLPRRVAQLRWRLLAAVGAVSLVTMPITAIWFLLLGPLTFVAAAATATFTRSPSRRADVLATGASIGCGLLVGPITYLALAIVA